jgi:hypothetical protein
MPLDEGELDQIGKFRLPTPVPPICPQCGYNLTGLNEPPCPECGYEFDWRSVRRKARMQWLEAMGLKTLPEEIEFGWRLAGIAWGVAILVFLGRTFIPWDYCSVWVMLMLMYSVEAFMAFCAAFLCSHVIRFQRLPIEAREELRIDVPITKAWGGLLAATALLVVDLPLLGWLFAVR